MKRMDSHIDEVCDCASSDKCTHLDLCGKPMEVKNGKFGQFKACTGSPGCHNTKPILHTIGVLCPKPECEGELVERQARGRGRSLSHALSAEDSWSRKTITMPHVLRVLGKSPTRILITKVALYALNVVVYLHNKAARSTNAQLVVI